MYSIIVGGVAAGRMEPRRMSVCQKSRKGFIMKVIIVGGVAAGASAAARLRRLDETAEIILLEKGDFISYANCGLPYHLGNVIPERDDLLVVPPEQFAAWFRIEVRTGSEAVRIDRAAKRLRIRGKDGGEYDESYDKLLLATGAVPVGEAANSRVFPLWTLADMDRIAARLAGAKRAVIVGAGFIGLEAAENLRERGVAVTIVQRGTHVLPTLDDEMTAPLDDELARLGIRVIYGRLVAEYIEKSDSVEAVLDDGERLECDLVITAIGVRPNTKLALDSALKCGARGHISVDEHLCTSDPDIYAAGDAVEVVEPIFGGPTAIPLAGPANKQGRIAADNIAGGSSVYRGSFGTSAVKIGNLTAAGVGFTEKRLRDQGREYRKLYIHPASNASYYPGGSRMALKLLFGVDGTIYGAQIVGARGVDKRIDSIAQAMRNRLRAPQLGELELAYAPPYSSAKDPVNFAGFVAENLLSGLSDEVHADAIPPDASIVDVRTPEEYALGAIPGARNIPLAELRSRLAELDPARLTVCYCQVGLRGYLAERILKQHGCRAANLSGGWLTWKMFHHERREPAAAAVSGVPESVSDAVVTLDLRSLACPGPILRLRKTMAELHGGARLRLLAASTFEGDLRSWAAGAGHAVVRCESMGDHLEAEVVRGGGGESPAGAAVSAPPAAVPAGKSAAIVLFSNDFDKAMAALILANGFAAAGAKVTIFFTFWGLSVLRRNPAPAVRKNFISRLFGLMLPTGATRLALSKMNMCGMGSAMMKSVMKRKGVLTLPELIRSAREAGVRFIACDMAMDVMGISRDELIEVDEVAGVATFAGIAGEGGATLFI